MTRKTKLFAGILAAALLILALDMKLAQPERRSPGQNNFIGFFLAYENFSENTRDESAWTEYGSETTYISGLGRVNFPHRVLIAETEDDKYTFPGMEGYNCFLALYTDEYGEQYLRGHDNLAESHLTINNNDHSLTGTVYHGPALDDHAWNTSEYGFGWTAYRVYQSPEGMVYIDGTGNSYGGVGGFGFSEKVEQTTTINGEKTTSTLEVSVKLEAIPRLESVTINQFDEADQLLRTDVLTAQQAAALEGGALTLNLDDNTAYAVIIKNNADGSSQREIHNVVVSGSRAIHFTSWFLKDNGMGYGVPVYLRPAPEPGASDWEVYKIPGE